MNSLIYFSILFNCGMRCFLFIFRAISVSAQFFILTINDKVTYSLKQMLAMLLTDQIYPIHFHEQRGYYSGGKLCGVIKEEEMLFLPDCLLLPGNRHKSLH